MTWCSIIRSSFVLSLSAKLSREEPDAVILHVRTVGGEGGNILTYPATSCGYRFRARPLRSAPE